VLRPTPRALRLAAAGVALAVLPALAGPAWILPWLAAWAALLLAGGVDAALCPPPGRLTVDLATPGLLGMDETGEADLTLSAPARRPLAAEVVADVSAELAPPDAARVALGREPGRLALPLRPLRRGTARIAAVWVRYEGPLGLVRRTTVRRLDREIPVVPNLGLVRRRAVEHFSSRDALAGLKVERYPGEGSEFHALREFSIGLDRRAIDWKASARHTRLLARETRAERNHQLVLALDGGRLMAEPVDGVPLLDHAIHAALLLAFVSLRYGDRVGFYHFDERPRSFASPRGGMGTMGAISRLSAAVGYAPVETNFALGLTELSRRLRRRALVVVFTDFVDAVTAELMVDNLARLAGRQLVLFVAFRDPTLAALRDAAPRDLVDVDRAVVAGTLERERETVIGRLRRLGIHVVDAVPARVGPRLIDRYLRIKRREMV